MPTIDVAALIDRSRISPLQLRVFVLCGLVVVLDGIDYQLVGIAAPAIAREFGLGHAALGLLLSAGPFGAAIGALACGVIADRIGRQRTLVAAALLFGGATLATGHAAGIGALTALRFLTGLGLGGAVPCSIALASEYAPLRRRAAIVGLLWAGFPFGGMTGGFGNACLIQVLDWRRLFDIWGLTPVAASLALALLLPESVRFLILRRGDGAALRTIVARLAGPPPVGSRFVSPEAALPGSPVGHLFRDGRAGITLSLWVVLFLILGILTVLAAWTPTLMTAFGYSASEAALVIGVHGLGSFLGTGTAGWATDRYGVGRFVVPVFLVAAATLLWLGEAAHHGFGALLTGGLLTGLFLGAGNSSVVALSALAYPTAVRSTGVGWAIAMGRFGSVIGPVLTGLLVAVGAGMTGVFGTLAASLLLAVPFVWRLDLHSRRRALLGPAGMVLPALGPAASP